MTWLLIFGAFAVGLAKTSIGGLAVLAVLSFAMAMPAKESTGAVLLVYLAGDVVATWLYRRNCRWRTLGALLPWVVPGLVLGAWFLSVVDGVALKRWIGVILAVSVLLHLVVTRSSRSVGLAGPGTAAPVGSVRSDTAALPPDGRPSVTYIDSHGRISAGRGPSGGRRKGEGAGDRTRFGRLATGVAGLAAGFTTMAANAGGPVMTIYLLLQRVDKLAFVGTAAWYFFLINLTKVPFSIAVGAITWDVAWTALPLAPVVWLGCFVGVRLLRVVGQRLFDALALASSGVAALLLVLS